MNWELAGIFKIPNEAQVVSRWLCLERAREKSQFYVVLYNEQHRCLKVKYISLGCFNRLLRLWAKSISKEILH